MDNALQILVQITTKIKAYLEGVWWLLSIILILGKKRQKDHEFKAIFSYIMRLCLFFFKYIHHPCDITGKGHLEAVTVS